MLIADIPCHPSSLHIEAQARRSAMGERASMQSYELINVEAKPLEVTSLVHGQSKISSIALLAEDIGVSQPTLRKAMKGKVVRKINAQKIADYFDVDLEYITNEIKG